MKSRKQIIKEAVLNELTGLGAFITPDYMAREALVKGWSDPKIDMGFGYSTGYTPQEVMGGFAEHGSPFLSKYDRVSAYLVANARNRAQLRKQHAATNDPKEQDILSQKMVRRYGGLRKMMKRARAVEPRTTRDLGAFAASTDRMYALHYPKEVNK